MGFMSWLTGSSSQDVADPEEQRRAEQRRQRQALEDRWRADRNQAIQKQAEARRAYEDARYTYRLYAPGPQKDAAGQEMNRLADDWRAAMRAFDAINDFEDWKAARA